MLMRQGRDDQVIGVSPAYFISRYSDRFTPAEVADGLAAVVELGCKSFQLEVYHRELRGNEYQDIKAAFQDRRLREDIVNGYSLNVNVLEKYIQIHRAKRIGDKRDDHDANNNRYVLPGDKSIKTLKKIGIDLSGLAGGKTIE